MAKTWSQTQTFSLNNKYTLTLTATEESTSIPDNTSVVRYTLTMATTPNSFVGYSDYKTTISCVINGVTVYSYSASRNFNAPNVTAQYSEVLTTGTITVIHDPATGAKNCACTATVTVATDTYSPGTATCSGSLTLTTLPRTSSASWDGNFVIGSPKTITISRASNAFTHKLKFTVGTATETVPAGYAGTSYSWTPTAARYASQFPTQTSRTGTLVLYTYNSGTLIGSETYSFTLEIPASWKPSSLSVSLSPNNDNPWIAGKGLYVAGKTKINVAASATASDGSTLVSWTVSGAFSASASGASLSVTSGIIATSGTKTVTVTVTDSRGRSSSSSVTCSYVSYTAPAITSLTYARGTYVGGVWTSSDAGEDLRVTFAASCSLAGSPNNNSMTYSVPVMGGASGSNTSGQTITLYKTGIGSVTAYTVAVTVTDLVGTSSTRSVYVPTVEIPFVIDPTLPAIGVGAVPQNARTLELASNWLLNAGAGVTLPYTTDILASATSQASGTVKAYRGTGSTYTGTVPNSYFGYGSFLVLCRATTSIIVVGFSSRPTDGIAINYYNGSWSGWSVLKDRYVDKTHAVSFSAGTIGTRAQAYSWTSADIGGAPYLMQVVDSSGLASFLPICTISGTNAYLNIYRGTASAFSSGSITVRIWY